MFKELEDSSMLTAEQISEWIRKDCVLAIVLEYIVRGWPAEEISLNPELAAYQMRNLMRPHSCSPLDSTGQPHNTSSP